MLTEELEFGEMLVNDGLPDRVVAKISGNEQALFAGFLDELLCELGTIEEVSTLSHDSLRRLNSFSSASK